MAGIERSGGPPLERLIELVIPVGTVFFILLDQVLQRPDQRARESLDVGEVGSEFEAR